MESVRSERRTGTAVGVGIVVRRQDGRILIGERRSDATPSQALPGGKPEANETMEDCAIRELAEETGLSMRPDSARVFGCALAPGTPLGWVVVGVTGEVDQSASQGKPLELEPEKNGNYRWVDPNHLPANLYPASAALLEIYLHHTE
jgi:ADP-ribose pyrophosphatase YjhB (NUDIX family)